MCACVRARARACVCVSYVNAEHREFYTDSLAMMLLMVLMNLILYVQSTIFSYVETGFPRLNQY